jgi:uncharacterized protein (DUF1501 family)
MSSMKAPSTSRHPQNGIASGHTPFINVLSRRGFLDHCLRAGAGVGLAALTQIPPFAKRALAEGGIGTNGKKLLFIWLRGANDTLNSLIPILDPAYSTANRPTLFVPPDPGTQYDQTGACDFPVSGANPTFQFANAIRLGNGFAALHPSLKFLAPVFNAGDLAFVNRVGYPKQSRSHFDSQAYWENGNPNNNTAKDGIFYRTIIESGLASTAPLTGVSVQSGLPLILRGSEAAMTNLTDPTRYNLLGIPNTTAGNAKADASLVTANQVPFPDKLSRQLLSLQYQNLDNTLSIFAGMDFSEGGNTYVDNVNTDGDTAPYSLFPTSNTKNGGYALHGNDTGKYVVDTTSYGYFRNLKAAALILNQTDAIIAGSEFGGWDTHNNQGGVTGAHANLLRRLAWSIYGLQKFFQIYGRNGTAPMPGAKCSWDDVVIVTLTEFGRTSKENGSAGTDHAEAGLMLLAGGGVKGYQAGSNSGVLGCHPGDPIPWITGDTGSMFGVSNRYLKRTLDYRSVLGRVIRDHLGATQNQLNRIIPGYTVAGEALQSGGTSTIDNTPILGEPDVLG